MLESIARLCFTKYRLVIAIWVIAVIGFLALGNAITPQWLQNSALPNAESTKAIEILEEEMPEAAAQASEKQGKIVFQANDDIFQYRNQIQSYLDALLEEKDETNVVTIGSPFTPENATQVSRDGKTAFATIAFSQDTELTGAGQVALDRAQSLREIITVEFSGQVFAVLEFPMSELIGIIAAILILLVAFGSIVAAGLPIITALLGVAIGTSMVGLWSFVFSVPQETTNVAAMIGIGVGIDYALFIITRYRVEIRDLKDREEATVKAMATAGAAVLFAGMTVVISLLGMLIIGLSFTNGLAIGTATAVLIAILASITFVPALLGSWFGKNIDKYSIPYKKPIQETPEFWIKWAEFVQKNAKVSLIFGVALLVFLSIPLFSLNTGVADEGNGSSSQTTKRAYDILAESFGPGVNGPLVLVVDASEEPDQRELIEIVREIEKLDGVAAVIPSSQQLVLNSETFANAALRVVDSLSLTPEQQANVDRLRQALEPETASPIVPIQVVPETSPQSQQTTALVKQLRSEVIPALTEGSQTQIYVSGVTAANIDFADIMEQRFPYFILAVLILSFFLLMAVFRSVAVAIKAVILNLLSIGAAYGAIVAIFQWGWMSDLFGIGAPGPIEPWAPMLLFAIVFGLSMDYEVFLLSKIREEYVRTKDNSRAVRYGLASTARVITAAALIMICVFGSFVLADDRILKLMGLGLAIAIFVDATIVRLVLVPATMEILGDRNWWFPKWLDRIVPKIHVEGTTREEQTKAGV